MKFKCLSLLTAVCGMLVLLPACSPAGTTVAIKGTDNMKYDVTQIDAKPGETIQVSLTNAGTLPKTAMAHNWVLLKKGADASAYTTAASKAKDEDYLPAALNGEVLAHTRLLGPGESDTITLTAPTEPGDYVFLCSFPAHYLVGMKGILTVK